MPKVVYLNAGIFDHPGRLAALAGVAALHELVLIGARRLMVDGRLAVLRQALAPRRMVALLVGDDLSGIERAQVEDLLNDGVIALIIAVGGTPASPAMAWLLQDDTPPDPGSDHHLALAASGDRHVCWAAGVWGRCAPTPANCARPHDPDRCTLQMHDPGR